MDQHEQGQAPRSPAEVYDTMFVPALFRQRATVVSDEAAVGVGQRVLDVACGTGALSCVAAERVGPEGSVAGLDINEGMLVVARGKTAAVEWRQGRAPKSHATTAQSASHRSMRTFQRNGPASGRSVDCWTMRRAWSSS